MQAAARRVRAEADALAEVIAAKAALQDAILLDDANLLAMADRRIRRIDPALLPERWAVWVQKIRDLHTAIHGDKP